MNKYLLLAVSGLFAVSGSASAIGIYGQAGHKYTSIGVGMGTSTSGVALSGDWTRHNDDGYIADLGLGYNLPVGPAMVTLGGKGLYIKPDQGKTGYALGIGGGLSVPVVSHVSVFGQYYYAPDAFASGIDSYQEVQAGGRWMVFRPLTVEAGYRYMSLKDRNDNRNTIIDGPYLGVSAAF
ncbi:MULTISPECIES: YfaZ family outer membrane protein [Mangrovibacter]|uniref:YfaZ n=1 Tax=Mangrovibacter plantisponsor TaxID=451513 RepID=A0A317Q0Y5_9ENTR|nr:MULTISPECIES: YfaZ family outer membrane protein [Mangrovibacter]KEA50018.1 membrane protein [Mangrovibacter sp. MFB070]PWW09609.1 YfaZ precursor [Mangrovibacter plantisponsor]